MSSYPIPATLICNQQCRRTQKREPAHTGLYRALQRYEISQYFEMGPRQNWLFFRFWGDVLYDIVQTHMDKILLSQSGYLFVSQIICQLNITFFELCWLKTITDTKLTHEILWNLSCAYQKHLIIQLANLQIDTMNLNTTFRHCKIKSDYFWTRV